MSDQVERKLRFIRFALSALPPLVWAVWLAYTSSVGRMERSPLDAIMSNMGAALVIALVVALACVGVYYAYRATITRT